MILEKCPTLVTAPLNQLRKKEMKWTWEEKQVVAFEQLKSLLTSPPILAAPSGEGKFLIYTDASQTGISGVLVQEQEGGPRAIHYASRTLNKRELNYSTTEKECLAIVFA